MGIRLDWEIEAEQSQMQNSGEDRATAMARRRIRLRLLLVILVFLGIIGAVIATVSLRLQDVEFQVEQSLRDTVDAEVATLRIGDYKTFISVQRSASDAWLLEQEAVFNNYQTLKQEHDVQLTGRIVDATINKERGRVLVEEIIDGIPYTQAWFYWRYNDGWRHVPPDYTFWGEVASNSADGVTVRYQEVDKDVASALGESVREWIRSACGALVCGELPEISVDIVPDKGMAVSWAANDIWRLQVPSPFVEGARSDMPFDFDLRLQVANEIAERLVAVGSNNLQPVYPADAWYLHQAVISWLVGRFVHIDTNSFLVQSLAEQFGEPAVGVLLQFMQPNARVDILSAVTGVPSLDQLTLDWRDLLTWRLVTEDELIGRGDLDGYLSLYDNQDSVVRSAAILRYDTRPPAETRVVTLVRPATSFEGLSQLEVTVQVGQGETAHSEILIFRLVNNVWVRAN